MKIERFEDIIAWQKAKDLTTQIYTIFDSCKDYSFRDQIRRASVSVMNNIAEGFERQTNKEFKNFLYISKGSCAEIRSMSDLAYELKYLSCKNKDLISASTIEISKILSGFIKTLR
jgi:four helix bundle protein